MIYLLLILCILLSFYILVQILYDIGVYIWNEQYFLFDSSYTKVFYLSLTEQSILLC